MNWVRWLVDLAHSPEGRLDRRAARPTAPAEPVAVVAADQGAARISEIVPAAEMYDVITGAVGGGAGVPVTERTAMATSAVYASVGLLGGAVASLPFHIYRRSERGRERIDSDLWWLFNESPWGTWTAASAWSWVVQSIGLRGDGFQRIHRVTPYTNAIQGFEPLHPAAVNVRRVKGRNVYAYTDDDGQLHTVDQDDILHFPGIGFDGVRSITPLRAALRAGAGIAIAADEYAGAFFRNGARADYALQTDKAMSAEQAQQVRESWADKHRGLTNAHNVAILHSGLKVQQLTMTAEDSQLLGTRQFQVADIARIFGVPPHMIGHTEKSTSWGSGVEQMSIGFVRYTLQRYLDAIRQEINRKVWPRSRQVYAEHSTEALLEGDAKAQAEYFSKALGGPCSQGWMVVNEVRQLKNLPPVPEGDTLIRAGVPAALAPAGQGAEPVGQPKGKAGDGTACAVESGSAGARSLAAARPSHGSTGLSTGETTADHGQPPCVHPYAWNRWTGGGL